MLFDIRGRRKNVVRVVYAVLAVLMGLSLFLVVGGLNIAELFTDNTSTTEASEQFEDQAERIEAKLRKDPENPDLLLALTRARVNAGNSLVFVDPRTKEQGATPESRQQYQLAADSWTQYTKATDDPNPSLAQIVAPAFVSLTLASRTVSEAEANTGEAVRAQEIVAKERPSVGTLGTLALYKFFAFEFDEAEKVVGQAMKLAASKEDRQKLAKEAKSNRQAAEQQQAAYRKFEKQEKAANAGSGGQLGNSLGNTLGGSGLTGE